MDQDRSTPPPSDRRGWGRRRRAAGGARHIRPLGGTEKAVPREPGDTEVPIVGEGPVSGDQPPAGDFPPTPPPSPPFAEPPPPRPPFDAEPRRPRVETPFGDVPPPSGGPDEGPFGDWSERVGAPPPPDRGRGPIDFSLIFVLLDLLRRATPADLQDRVTTLIREALLTLRSLIDWYLDKLDRGPEEPRVEDIPID